VYPQLREYPHFGPNIRKLKGFHPETWRYRIGAWRFFYEIDEEEKIVFMIAAHHRSVAY
jgi:mRNA interferase RelE/StbE